MEAFGRIGGNRKKLSVRSQAQVGGATGDAFCQGGLCAESLEVSMETPLLPSLSHSPATKLGTLALTSSTFEVR